MATSENFAELVYNGQNHIEDNVSAPKLKSYSTLANVVIGSANNTKVIVSDSTSVSTYGAFAVYKSFDSGDATTQANAWLAESKELQQVFSMVVRPDSVDANV